MSQSTKDTTPDPTKAESVRGRGTFYQESNHDKLASDKIGEELNPNACIWRLYAEEAKEYDTEVTHERNENLNNMLLFATLFSAIVTAFVIESTSLLEQDSSEISNQLLLALVQSQQRVEAGTPGPTLPPIEIPEFVPSGTVRLINVLWFASLMISLAAAVVAILAKEWLAAFISYQTRDPHKYALERHARLASRDAWNMVPIIDLLPTFLYLALFLFSLGLLVRLWLLDFIVAVTVTCISAILGLVYLFFMIAGAASQDCPYKALLSIYFRSMVKRILDYFHPSRSIAQDAQKNVEPADTQKNIKPEEIELLTWLFNYSTDPILGDYVTQALAGLKSLSLELPTFLDRRSIGEIRRIYTENIKVLTSVFELGSQAMDQLQIAPTGGRNELEFCGGSSAARLAIALSEIYPYVLTWKLCFHTQIHAGEKPPKESTRNSVSKRASHDSTSTINMLNVCKITDNVFGALDLVWAETSPPLTLSTYAYLLAAELKLARHALIFLGHRKEESPTNSSHASIEMTTLSTVYHESLGLTPADPRERYSIALIRTALIIKASLNHITSKGSQELQSAIVALLSEATELVVQEKPNHNDPEHQFVFHIRDNQDISITITSEANRIRRVTCEPRALGYELMEGLVKLCDNGSQDALLLEGFRVAAFNLLLTFWPAYAQHRRLYECVRPEIPPWAIQPWEMVRVQATPCNSSISSEIIIYQSIVFAYIVVGLTACDVLTETLWERKEWLSILHLIVRVLVSRSGTLSSIIDKLASDPGNTTEIIRSSLYYRWLPTNPILENWILSIHKRCLSGEPGDETSYILSWCIGRLVDVTDVLTYMGNSDGIDVLAQLRSSHSTTQAGNQTEHSGLQIDQLMEFIHASSQAAGRDISTKVIPTLLNQVTNYIETTDCHECLKCFAQGSGFDILSDIGRTESDREATASTLYSVLLALQAAELVVNPEVLPPLCDAMCYICDHSMARVLYDPDLFVPSARLQLQQLPRVIGPTTYFAIHKLIYRLTSWAERIESESGSRSEAGSECSDTRKVIALRDQVQRWVDSASDSFYDGASSPTSDRATSVYATQRASSSSGVLPIGNEPEEASNLVSNSGRAGSQSL